MIPHAGKQYAGPLRKTAFDALQTSNPALIIYLSAIHNTKGLSNGIYELKDDLFRDRISKRRIKIPQYPTLNRAEHSFDWVEQELQDAFPDAAILALTPVGNIHHATVQLFVQLMRQWKDLAIIATTDLIHYGKQFHNEGMLGYPERLDKIIKEERFIHALVQKPPNIKQIQHSIKDDYLLCGPHAVLLFSKIMNSLNYGGKVVEYYDSSTSGKMHTLDGYVIKPKKTSSFVSYVSIVYGANIHQNVLSELDILMAIGTVKSVILRDMAKKKYAISLPIWSPFYNRRQGVFVGTSLNDKTSCSYGRYEGAENTAIKIVDAAGDCVKDAHERWNRPYKRQDMDKMKYKVELLAPKKSWKRYVSDRAPEVVPLDGKHGVYLNLPNVGAATFLPVVSRDNPDWSIDTYMKHLARKAGNSNGVWKGGIIHVYDSQEYVA